MQVKKCSICGQEKTLENFPFRKVSEGTYRAHCKQCHSNTMKKKYYENKEAVSSIKTEKGCAKCGYNENAMALDFHHINPTEKEDTIARLTSGSSLSRALQEIEKCVVLCANCHRVFHCMESESNITIEEFLKSE